MKVRYLVVFLLFFIQCNTTSSATEPEPPDLSPKRAVSLDQREAMNKYLWSIFRIERVLRDEGGQPLSQLGHDMQSLAMSFKERFIPVNFTYSRPPGSYIGQVVDTTNSTYTIWCLKEDYWERDMQIPEGFHEGDVRAHYWRKIMIEEPAILYVQAILQKFELNLSPENYTPGRLQ